jgi:N-methylhydantoinase A
VAYRITSDVGGTFTDIAVAEVGGAAARVVLGKAPTTPDRAVDGLSAALTMAAEQLGVTSDHLLQNADMFVYSTTRATNAIIERKTSDTALLTTAGFPDILVLREGGRPDPFRLDIPYPEPYIPRRRTFEISERMDAEGSVVEEFDREQTIETIKVLRDRGIEAVAVCLVWSIVNPAHELAVAELLDEHLPGVPYTLSHQLISMVREYRRASTTAIDASLKPLMSPHLAAIKEDLAGMGFAGELLAATSVGGVMHMDDLSAQPVYSARSGPSLAPVAGRAYGERDLDAKDVIVYDVGGTSFDVSLVRDGEINYTRETWLGDRFVGDLIAASSVDVRSVGSGGGSIAWVDAGGLLHVGPLSAGAQPGPACYGRGGERPTVTDAAVVLGYFPIDRFLGGRMTLDEEAAKRVMQELTDELGTGDIASTALHVLQISNEHMVQAIQEITVGEGVDPRESLLLAGGGAAGLGAAALAKELDCKQVLMPRPAGALSALGGQLSAIVAEFSVSHFTDTSRFDHEATNQALERLDALVGEFAATLAERGYPEYSVDYLTEARYASQVWELELPLPVSRFDENGASVISEAFDRLHERVYAIAQPGMRVECLTWKARMSAPIAGVTLDGLGGIDDEERSLEGARRADRSAHFADTGWVDTAVYDGTLMPPDAEVNGPAIIEEPTSTLVVPPDAIVRTTSLGNYLVEV